MKPAEFLNKYDTIIFDMDGVITSEQNYWNIAALSVFELVNDNKFFGNGTVNPSVQADYKEIRKELFFGDKFITAVKEKGVNSNWDLCYLAFCYLVSGDFTPETMTKHVTESKSQAFDLYEEASMIASKSLNIPVNETKRGASIWLLCRKCFQEWYLGDRLYEEMYLEKSSGTGKKGMWQKEDPLLPLSDTVNFLKTLSEYGFRLGIATGRNKFEVTTPLIQWDCLKYFDENSVADYDYVVRGEENLKKVGINAMLTKPHPYLFLKALYGTDYDDVKLYNGEYDKSRLKRALMVGDAGSDILAAKAMGSDFLAVLTGVSGEKARPYFENTGAEYIVPNILSMLN